MIKKSIMAPRITRGNFLKRMAEEEARFYRNQPRPHALLFRTCKHTDIRISPAELKVGAKKL